MKRMQSIIEWILDRLLGRVHPDQSTVAILD